MSDEHFRKLERMYLAAPNNQYYRPTIAITNGSAEVAIEVRHEFFHAANAIHGSVYFKALDDATFFAANSLVNDVFVLTVSFNLHLLRPVSEGRIVAHGRVVSRSKRLVVADGVLVDDRGREVARGTGTFMPSSTALTSDIGYE